MLYAPERILVAPSGFKESLSAIEVAGAIAAGIRRVLTGSRVHTVPVRDGGEGTVEMLGQRDGAVSQTETVTGPVAQKVQATWVELPESGVGVMELASCAGLTLGPRGMRDPGATTTYGVGQLINIIIAH